MKKRMSKLLTSIFSILLVATVAVGFIPTANAEENSPEIHTEGLWDYYVQDGEAVTVRFDDDAASGDVEVPATLGGYPVTTIGSNTFFGSSVGMYWNKNISGITISNNVDTIEDYAFSACIGLEYVDFGDSVTTIGTIEGCSIDTIFIGNKVTNSPSFSYASIKNIIVSDSNKYFSSEDGVLFNKNKTKLIKYPGNNPRTSYIIPNSVTTIGIRAFSGQTSFNLETLIIPISVETIEEIIFFEQTPNIYYEGSESQWNNISIAEENEYLLNYIDVSFDYDIPSSDNNDTDEEEKSFWNTVVSVVMTVVDFISSIFNTVLSWFN